VHYYYNYHHCPCFKFRCIYHHKPRYYSPKPKYYHYHCPCFHLCCIYHHKPRYYSPKPEYHNNPRFYYDYSSS
jgi:hypothetical protein